MNKEPITDREVELNNAGVRISPDYLQHSAGIRMVKPESPPPPPPPPPPEED